jgi:hypothetical protein
VLDNRFQVPSVVCGVDINYFLEILAAIPTAHAISGRDCVSQATLARSERYSSKVAEGGSRSKVLILIFRDNSVLLPSASISRPANSRKTVFLIGTSLLLPWLF